MNSNDILSTIWFGSAHYPEHSPETLKDDIDMMVEAHCNVVRLAEFAWCRLEPAENIFEFGWLDEVIQAFHARNIAVIIGTPTAGPPAWLVNPDDPNLECRQKYEDGVRWELGGRSLCCVNHPRFIDRAQRIAYRLGSHYARNPAVVGFQIDNELGMYGSRCYCPACLSKFRDWLETKYQDIQNLNHQLGMIFGSGEYRAFSDIPLPRLRQDLHNPGLLLESQRFFSESNVAFVNAQATVLREGGVLQPITTNVCHMFGGGDEINGKNLFQQLDVAGWDCYPVQFGADPSPHLLGFLHTVARGFKSGQRYWMLEQQSGSPMGMAADDLRRIRLWTWQAFAHGANMMLYFRWRTCRFGGEQYWRGIIDHDGERNERHAMIQTIGSEVRALSSVIPMISYRSQIAIFMDYDENWSQMISEPSFAVKYRSLAADWFGAVQANQQSVDVVFHEEEIDSYKIIILPLKRLMNEKAAIKFRSFVESGGILVASFATSTLDSFHVAPSARTPWLLADLFGVERFEWSALGRVKVPPKERMGEHAEAWANLGRDGQIPVVTVGGYLPDRVHAAGTWADHLRTTTAETWAEFAGGSPLSKLPAVTCNQFGKGLALYIAAQLDVSGLEDILRAINPAREFFTITEDHSIEIVPHFLQEKQGWFLLNHLPHEVEIILSMPLTDQFSNQTIDRHLKLQPYDVAWLIEP